MVKRVELKSIPVKLTKEQADAVEYALNMDAYRGNPEKLLDIHEKNKERPINFHNKLKELNGLSVKDLAKAIYVGYELFYPASIGEWVVVKTKEGAKLVGEVIGLNEGGTISLDTDINTGNTYSQILRKANKLDMKLELTRRKWEQIGRKPKEFKRLDLVRHDVLEGYYEVVRTCNDGSLYLYVNGNPHKIDYTMKDKLALVVPAEQRFDVVHVDGIEQLHK